MLLTRKPNQEPGIEHGSAVVAPMIMPGIDNGNKLIEVLIDTVELPGYVKTTACRDIVGEQVKRYSGSAGKSEI